MQNRGANRARLLSRLSGAPAGFLTSVLLLSATAIIPEAAAQQQLRQHRAAVEVDWSVLEELNNEPPPARIILRPPSAARAPAPAPAEATPPASPTQPALQAKKAKPEKAKTAAKPTAPSQKTAKAAPEQPKAAEKPAKVLEPAATATPAFTPPPPPPSFNDKPPTRSVAAEPVQAAAPGAVPPPPPSVMTRAVSASPFAPTPLAPRQPEPVVAAPAASVAPSVPEPPPAPVVVAAPPVQAAPPPAPVVAAPAPAPQPEPVVVAAPAVPAPPPAPTPAPPAPQVATSPAAEASPAPGQQLAALPPANIGGDGRMAVVSFPTGTADLPEAARMLLERAAAEMKRDENVRLQLVAYAAGSDDTSSQARRLSLSRALAVRSYLIEHGVRSTRMDVRALGNKVPEGPPDRVDVMLVRR
jgi:outer membrane protein OmpA-like peptidoglycan-associated protein